MRASAKWARSAARTGVARTTSPTQFGTTIKTRWTDWSGTVADTRRSLLDRRGAGRAGAPSNNAAPTIRETVSSPGVPAWAWSKAARPSCNCAWCKPSAGHRGTRWSWACRRTPCLCRFQRTRARRNSADTDRMIPRHRPNVASKCRPLETAVLAEQFSPSPTPSGAEGGVPGRFFVTAPSARSVPPPLLGLRLKRYPHGERAALAGARLHVDLAAVGRDDVMNDRQPQARPALLADARVVGPEEALP